MKRKITMLVAIVAFGLQLFAQEENECEKITNLPYTEDFNSCGVQSSDAIPDCWVRTASHMIMWEYPSCLTNSSSVTGNFLCFMAFNGDTNIITAPELSEDIDITKLKVSFLYESSQVGMEFVVGVIENPRDAQTFIPVDTVKASSSLVWEQMTVTFENYEGEGKYIAFWLGKPYTSNQYASAFMDNVVIEFAVSEEPCSVKPSQLEVNYITTENAVVTWKENSTAVAWMLYYKKNSDTEFDSVQVWDEPYYDFENYLEPKTTYNVFVKSDCGDYNPLSSDTVTFSTKCDAMESLPFEEDFESYQDKSYPECWAIAAKYSYGYYGEFPSVRDYSGYPNGGKALGLQGDETDKSVAVINALPQDTDIKDVKLSFWFSATYGDMASSGFYQAVVVGVMTDAEDLSTFVPVDTVEITTTDWELKQVYFNKYDQDGKYIAFWAGYPYNESALQEYYIDNIKIETVDTDLPCTFAPTEVKISDLSTNTATVTWEDEYYTGQWYVYYKQSASAVYDSVLVEELSYTFEEDYLQAGQSYEVYVKSYCSEDSYSPSSNHLLFQTQCEDITSLPYIYTFDNDEMYSVPQCWSSLRFHFYSDIYYPGILTNGYNSSKWMAFMNDNNEEMMVISPKFSEALGEMNQLQVKFQYIDYFSNGELRVGIMTDPDDKETFELIETVAGGNDWEEKTVSLAQYEGEGRYIAFYAGGDNPNSEGIMIGIDQVEIGDDLIAPCEDIYDTLTIQTCEDSPYNFFGKDLSQSGVYYDTNILTDGCKEITVLYLEVNSVTDDTVYMSICDNETYLFGGEEYKTAGIYTQTFSSVNGCDSSITLVLSVNATYNINLSAEINEGEIYTESGFNADKEGEYVQNLKSIDGCDSIITLTLKIKSSLNEAEQSAAIALYPNPVQNQLNVTLNGIDNIESAVIVNSLGQRVKTLNCSATSKEITVSVNDLPQGVYYINIIADNKVYNRKFIKK